MDAAIRMASSLKPRALEKTAECARLFVFQQCNVRFTTIVFTLAADLHLHAEGTTRAEDMFAFQACAPAADPHQCAERRAGHHTIFLHCIEGCPRSVSSHDKEITVY